MWPQYTPPHLLHSRHMHWRQQVEHRCSLQDTATADVSVANDARRDMPGSLSMGPVAPAGKEIVSAPVKREHLRYASLLYCIHVCT
jgi:hypothetical protein